MQDAALDPGKSSIWSCWVSILAEEARNKQIVTQLSI